MNGERGTSPSELEIRRLKFFYRRLLRAKILSIPPGQRDRAAIRVASLVRKWSRYKRAKVIAAYVSAGHEMGTGTLLRMALADGKKIALPVIGPRGMSFAPWDGKRSGLCLNRFGLWEPKRTSGRRIDPSRIDVAFVPGRGFSPRGNRLGAGGGYYDRFLGRRSRLLTVGLAFREQVVRDLPVTSSDVPVNAILSPDGWLRRSG